MKNTNTGEGKQREPRFENDKIIVHKAAQLDANYQYTSDEARSFHPNGPRSRTANGTESDAPPRLMSSHRTRNPTLGTGLTEEIQSFQFFRSHQSPRPNLVRSGRSHCHVSQRWSPWKFESRSEEH